MNNTAVFDIDPLPDGWRWVTLGDICHEDKTTIKPNDPMNVRLPYVSLEHVAAETGLIDTDAIQIAGMNVLSNTFRFTEKHVLYGKLRPYLNKVAIPDFEGRCTTEIIPLIPNGVSRNYLAFILRRPETVEFAMKFKTGSRMPRTDMRAFMNLPLPLPSIAEQMRIVGILEDRLASIEQAKRAAETQLDAINAMPAAFLRRAFAGEL